jgi:hypothetical protein
MITYDKKYGITEDKKIIRFHKTRRMFCIKDGILYIAKPDLPYSHAVWFEKMGWMSKENDMIMNQVIRGYVGETGDIYFYRGYDFQVDKQVKTEMLKHLRELKEKLKLGSDSKLVGGKKEIIS